MSNTAKKALLAFGPWEPDDVLLNGQQAPEARNVIPGKRGYRYLPGVSRLSFPQLPGGRCLAACTLRDVNGDLLTLAASASGPVYALQGGEWVAKLSDETVNTNRVFANWGPAMYMLHGTSLYKSTVSGGFGDFTAVSAAPKAQCMAIVKEFLVLGDLTDNRQRIQWSAMDDPDTWPTPGTDDAAAKQSDYQHFPEGGRVMAVMGAVGQTDGLVFLERAVQRMAYVGAPYVFNFKQIDAVRGLLVPKSPVNFGVGCIYLSDDGWYLTDGTATKAIGIERVDTWFFSQVEHTRISEIVGWHDPVNRICIWAFPSKVAKTGILDRVLIYSYDLDKWSYGALAVQTLFGDYARGETLDDLDKYGTLDSLPFGSLDVPAFMTGRSLMGCFDSEGYMGVLNGPPLEAVIETQEIGGDRMMVHGLRPLVDRGDAQALPIYRARQQDQPKYGPLRSQSRDGVCYQHLSTTYLSARVVIPGGGTAWRDAHGVEALIEPEGGM